MTGYYVTSTHKMFSDIKWKFLTSSLDKLKNILNHKTPDPERIDWEKLISGLQASQRTAITQLVL